MCISKEQFRDRIVQHKMSVLAGMQRVSDILYRKGLHHDDDKFYDDVFEQFHSANDKFDNVKFGSPEYDEVLKELKPALKIHYARNRHHPQFFKNGVSEMSLMDLVEMLVDWKSASSAYGDSFLESMKINKKRFNIDEQLYSILINTALELGYLEKEEVNID